MSSCSSLHSVHTRSTIQVEHLGASPPLRGGNHALRGFGANANAFVAQVPTAGRRTGRLCEIAPVVAAGKEGVPEYEIVLERRRYAEHLEPDLDGPTSTFPVPPNPVASIYDHAKLEK